MISPELAADSNKEQENLVKVTTGYAPVNQTSLTELEGVVPSEDQPQKLKARDRLVGIAQPIKRGQGEEGGGKTTSRDSQGPEGLTSQVMLELMLLILTAKNTR